MEFTITKLDRTVLTVQLSDQDADLAERRWHMAGGKGQAGKYVASSSGAYLHRVVAERMGLIGQVTGEGRSVPSVDHINGDKLDNRRDNLRLRTRFQQMTNPADRLRRTNTSGHRGVSFSRKAGKWLAHAKVDGRSMALGFFDTVEEAAARRLQWEANPWGPPPRHVNAPCGTSGGAQRHRRAGEQLCEPCRLARNADVAERARARRAG